MSYYPSEKEFIRLAKKGNVIPVYKEILADTETPVSAFLKIKDGYSYLLESVEGQEKIARYSFLGANPSLVFKSKNRHAWINGRKFKIKKDPLDELKRLMARYKFVSLKGLPRFCGGLVGYISYDTVRFFERIPDKNPDDLKLADCIFVLADTSVIFDHVNHIIKVISNACLSDKKNPRLAYKKAIRKIEALCSKLRKPLGYQGAQELEKTKVLKKAVPNISRIQFMRMVNKAKDYIRAGDIIQVVLSQRFKAAVSGDTFNIYRKLRSSNPSPYMFYLKFKDLILIGSSPEMLLRCEDGIVKTRPIAGTRRRGINEEEDLALEKELLQDKKERAEHIMLVDLGRNDLGRISVRGKVEVSEFMSIERYSHVMHIVSEVTAKLRPDKDIYDCLRAAFPAGTVSGAPKIRAMEIIDELESLRRGPYAGCVGYISFSGNLDTAITIRTIVVKGKTAYIQAGAGIVADSLPSREYQETVNKAKAQLEALS
ncbi:MAG: anthranilate synthase component I [Candidatus Omnitrophica bacterium]|nr:anthranilate synthase component I [Candidatus Omnitrophota bacterium]